MTKLKDKQIRKLKDRWIEAMDESMDWKTGFIMAMVFVAVFLALSISLAFEGNSLESQLQSYQEKVPVWTLKVNCDYGTNIFGNGEEDYSVNFTITFFNHNDLLDFLEDKDNCVVLE